MNTEFSLHPQLAKDCIELIDLPLCKLLLCNDKKYPWFILVPRVTQATDIYLLSAEQQQQFTQESFLLSTVIMEEFKGDKLNVAALGNLVPQLHVHHVVRFTTDICWPKPIWGQHELTPYTTEEINTIKAKVLARLG